MSLIDSGWFIGVLKLLKGTLMLLKEELILKRPLLLSMGIFFSRVSGYSVLIWHVGSWSSPSCVSSPSMASHLKGNSVGGCVCLPPSHSWQSLLTSCLEPLHVFLFMCRYGSCNLCLTAHTKPKISRLVVLNGLQLWLSVLCQVTSGDTQTVHLRVDMHTVCAV